jgi:Zn-dependent peptidase ImmA (M78 family)
VLKELSAEAESVIPEYTRRPHEQGELLARWARLKFAIPLQAKVDPDNILRSLGVEITQHRLGIDVIDAIGCWGSQHGPAILINLQGKHAQSLLGRRATLAHELAHVLLDRNGSLPAAEVLGGNVPRYPEQRANAFAAEFLFPKSILLESLRDTVDAAKTIKSLRIHYAVSHELAAWQIINTRAVYATLDGDARALLASWTPKSGDPFFFQ